VNLAALERTLTALAPTLIEGLAGALIAGLIVQALVAWRPAWRLVQDGDLQVAPWHRHLSQRMLYALVPLSVLAILTLLAVVWATSYRVATRLVIDQMARDAENAASACPFRPGRSQLIRDLAGDSVLQSGDPAAIEARLEDGLRAVPFFERLIYFDTAGEVVAAFPPLEESSSYSPAEISAIDLAVREKVPAEVIVETAESDPQTSESFVAPVVDPQTASLWARSWPDDARNNPILVRRRILESASLAPAKLSLMANRILLYPNQLQRQRRCSIWAARRSFSCPGSAGRHSASRRPMARTR
jgi:hypothetical protein